MIAEYKYQVDRILKNKAKSEKVKMICREKENRPRMNTDEEATGDRREGG